MKTVEDLHNGEYEVHGRTLKLEILDTSGSYQFPAMRRLSIRTADGFVLVYAIDDADSFEQVCSVHLAVSIVNEADCGPKQEKIRTQYTYM